jgi:hypothetical protein
MNVNQIEYIEDIVSRSIGQARRAIIKFPQPNYCLLKVAEEAGEVVKAGVHLSEGRDFSHADLEGEVIDTIAMLFRVLIEGDQVIGLASSYDQTQEPTP